MLFLFCMLVSPFPCRGDHLSTSTNSLQRLAPGACSCSRLLLCFPPSFAAVFFLVLAMHFFTRPCLFFVLMSECVFASCTCAALVCLLASIHTRLLVARETSSSTVLTCTKLKCGSSSSTSTAWDIHVLGDLKRLADPLGTNGNIARKLLIRQSHDDRTIRYVRVQQTQAGRRQDETLLKRNAHGKRTRQTNAHEKKRRVITPMWRGARLIISYFRTLTS